MTDLDIVRVGQLVALGDSVDCGFILLGEVPDSITGLNLDLGVGIGTSGHGQGTGGSQGSE